MYYKEIEKVNLTDSGYLYFIDKEHPLAVGNSGKVYLHRHIASIAAGRWITSEEHVHHIDECKVNNDPSNLQIVTPTEHTLIHKGQVLDVSCLMCGNTFKPDKSSSTFCSPACSDYYRVKDKTITKELLDQLIPKYSWVELGKMFRYSDTGIKKRAKALGCTIPKRK